MEGRMKTWMMVVGACVGGATAENACKRYTEGETMNTRNGPEVASDESSKQ